MRHIGCALARIACVLLLASLAHAADAPRAWLDRTSARLGETVTLNVQTSDTSAGAPDFSALERDFEIGGTQSSQQVSIVNGVRDARMLWAVALQPRREGQLTIPPLTIGAAQTAPLQLQVQAAAPPAQAGGDVFFEVEAQPTDPYVQQQVRYTVKLYYAVDLTGGNISDPKVDGLVAKHLGQDKQYVATVGGRRYQVVEQHYALTPERSGTLEIPALQFRGTTLDMRDPGSFFSRGREVGARSQPITLQVRAQPAGWPDGQPWLPVESLLLQDQSALPTQVRVGDAITRSVRLQAQGAGFEQLPELQLRGVDGADIYPDKSETSTRDDGSWLYGQRIRKFAIVPNRAGTLRIPAMQVTWWNTQTDRLQTTDLPAHTISVLPAVGAGAAPAQAAPTPAASPGGDSAGAEVAHTSSATSPYAPLLVDSQARFWRLVALMLALGWLATAAAWAWWARRRPQHRAAPIAAAPTTAAAQRAAFLRACSLGDLAAAERALLAWARTEHSEVRNLGELAQRLADASQRDALMRLQRARYAQAGSDGLATQLRDAFQRGIAWIAVATQRHSPDALPALYPHHD